MARILLIGVCALAFRADAVTLDGIASLIEQHLGSSHVSLRSIMSRMSARNPATDPDFVKVLDDLKYELKIEVGDRIKNDHDDANKALRDSYRTISQSTDRLVGQKRTVESRAKRYQSALETELQTLKEKEEVTKQLASAVAGRDELCAQQEKLRDIKVTPKGLPQFECDLSAEGVCASNLNNFRAFSTEIAGIVNAERKTAEDNYIQAAGSCRTANSEVESLEKTLVDLSNLYARHRADSKRQSPDSVMCSWEARYEQRCSQIAAHKKLVLESTTQNGGSMSHLDRQEEWRATEMGVCIMTLLSEGSVIDELALQSCEAQIDYERDVGVFDTKEEEVDTFLTPESTTCDETSITFGPSGPWIEPPTFYRTLTSSLYKQHDDAPSHELPFKFCQ